MNQASNHVRLQFLNNYYKKGADFPLFTNRAFEILGVPGGAPKVRFENNEWDGIVWSNWNSYVHKWAQATQLPTRFKLPPSALTSPSPPVVDDEAGGRVYGTGIRISRLREIGAISSASTAIGNLRLHSGAARIRDEVDAAFINDGLLPTVVTPEVCISHNFNYLSA